MVEQSHYKGQFLVVGYSWTYLLARLLNGSYYLQMISARCSSLPEDDVVILSYQCETSMSGGGSSGFLALSIDSLFNQSITMSFAGNNSHLIVCLLI